MTSTAAIAATTTATATTTANLSPTDIKTLEQTRQRLSQLTNSLASLQAQILASDPLPPWPSLHPQTLILAQLLSTTSTHLSTHSASLRTTSVYPLPTYPGREQEGLLGQLLRKKWEPGVEEWVEEGRGKMKEMMRMRKKKKKEGDGEREAGVEGFEDGGEGEEDEREEEEKEEELKGLWEWAGVRANEEARGYEWGGDVDDGDGDSEDEDEEEEEEEGEGKGEDRGEKKSGGAVVRVNEAGVGRAAPMPLEDVLRFMTRG